MNQDKLKVRCYQPNGFIEFSATNGKTAENSELYSIVLPQPCLGCQQHNKGPLQPVIKAGTKFHQVISCARVVENNNGRK